MRIVVWNVARGFAKTHGALADLKPDLAVIPECAETIGVPAGCSTWVGSNPLQGLAVLSFGDYRVSLDQTYDREVQWAAPVAVTGPHSFFLLAIWGQRPYGDGLQRALSAYRPELMAGPAIVAGDFNTNTKLDRSNRAHGRTVDLLTELGLTSAYHHCLGVAQGCELHPTHYHHYQVEHGFHIDYCFVPKSWLKSTCSVEVGTFSDWVATKRSDHVPLIVDVEMLA